MDDLELPEAAAAVVAAEGAPRRPSAGSEAARAGVSRVLRLAGGRLATQVVLVISSLIIPRLMGPEEYGRFSGIQAAVAMLSVLAAMGLPLVEMRFLTPLWEQGPRAEAVGLASWVWTIRLLAGLVAAAATGLMVVGSSRLQFDWTVAGGVIVYTAFRFTNEANMSPLISMGHVGRVAVQEFIRAVVALPVVVIAYRAGGIRAVVWGLAGIYALLAITGLRDVRRVLPLRLKLPARGELRPLASYAAASFVGNTATVVQAWFSVFALAAWVRPREAAFVGISIQVTMLGRALFVTAKQALSPLLVRFESAGEYERVRVWASLIMRLSVASACAATVGWALVGPEVTSLIFGTGFGPVYPCTILMLSGVMWFCAAAVCNVVLYVRSAVWAAPLSLTVYAAATLGGMAWATSPAAGPQEGAAIRVSAIYLAAAVLYFAISYALSARGGRPLPLVRSLLLMVPALLAIPVVGWNAVAITRIALAIAFLLIYAAYALGLGLLRMDEIKRLLHLVRGGLEGS